MPQLFSRFSDILQSSGVVQADYKTFAGAFQVRVA